MRHTRVCGIAHTPHCARLSRKESIGAPRLLRLASTLRVSELPGSGKTTPRRRVAAALNLPLIDKDGRTSRSLPDTVWLGGCTTAHARPLRSPGGSNVLDAPRTPFGIYDGVAACC